MTGNEEWRRSSFCSNTTCIEVAFDGEFVIVRSSKTGRALDFTIDEWQAFIDGVKNGEFDD